MKNRSGHNAPIEMKVKNVIEHEGFHYPSLYNDVAIVQLESKVQLSNNIATVCLPENLKNENFVGKTAIVTGWGLLGFGKRGTLFYGHSCCDFHVKIGISCPIRCFS